MSEIPIKEAEEGKPQMILCTGLASGREQMTPEMIGINLRSAKSPDNSGTVLRDVKINEDGPDGIFSDLPVRAMEKALKEAGIPAAISLSAGSYVCNDVLYSLLDHFSKSPTRCGFVHMPPQEKIPPETAARGLLCCLEAMIREC